MEQDVRDFDQIMANDDEVLPSELIERLVSPGNNLTVRYEYRGFTQNQLAEKAGVSKPYISMIESRRRATLKAIADVLDVDIAGLSDL